MKSIVIFTTLLSIALFALGNGSEERPCAVDANCEPDECCVTKFTGEKKICQDAGDDVGDVCGGDFFCNRCEKNLECVALAKQILDEYNCTFPANGTCQYPHSKYTPVNSHALVSNLDASIDHNETKPVQIDHNETKPVQIEMPTKP